MHLANLRHEKCFILEAVTLLITLYSLELAFSLNYDIFYNVTTSYMKGVNFSAFDEMPDCPIVFYVFWN